MSQNHPSSPPQAVKEEVIHGYVERITFQGADSGYTVAKLQEPRKREPTVIVGHLPGIQPGESLSCTGKWRRHLVYGLQFEVAKHTVEMPADIVGITKYLGSGMVKGIGPKYASRIVEHFGEATLRIIDSEPERLLEVAGIGAKRVSTIAGCWDDQKSIREIMIFLQRYDVSPAYAQKIFKRYGSGAVTIVSEDPYRLAREIRGIGFKSADLIARKMGYALDSPKRIEAAIEHTLSECSSDGHTCYPITDLVTLCTERLEVKQALVERGIESLYRQERIFLGDIAESHKEEKRLVWLSALYRAESNIVREVARLQKHSSRLRPVDVARAIEWVEKELKITLAENQREAVAGSMTEKLLIVTGGPGTGKSTITNSILRITQQLTQEILLAAPTGRAAKRMTEITGQPASTIHALLEFDFTKGGFKRNRENPLVCDLIIIDEASMIDTLLMNQLLRAIPSHARVILVGDIHQLPSVGPGNVLKDCIASKKIPVIELNQIFRQAAQSAIKANAHKILQGVMPDLDYREGQDFVFFHEESPESILETVTSLVSYRLPNKFGFDPIEDVQVLAPMRKGVIGTEQLNAKLQERLNPLKKNQQPLLRSGNEFRQGDKVMQLRNDYKKEVSNGDVGRITAIDTVDQIVTVCFDEREIDYDFSDLDDLTPSYAVSIHKSQGSEYPCVVIPVHTSHFKLLHRNLIYTGITRGRKLVILVGTVKALGIAVRNDDVRRRHTALKSLLSNVACLKPVTLSNEHPF